MKILRSYQEAAIKSVFQWFADGNTGHPLIVAPVGAGKSLMIAELVKQIHQQAAHTKVVIVTHVKELLVQNADEMRGQYPDCDFGFYCASLKQKRLHNDVTFASIQSVHDKALRFPKAPQVIIIDEAHLVSHNEATQYRKFIDACKQINPNCIVIGLTGTPFRADTGRLDEGEGRLFDGVCYEIEIGWMISNGYLCKPVTPDVQTKMSVTGVGTRNGDYIAGQLERAVDIDEVTKSCVKEIVQLGAERKKWLVFTAGVTHCEHTRDAIRAHGISCEMVTCETPDAERDDIIRSFKAGEIRCIVNVAVLTTGFNVPDIDLLAFMRPTKSPVLYIQCIGRGIRTAPDKQDCMVLDFGGVIDALGPIDKVDIRKRHKSEKDEQKEKSAPVMKICPSCGTECWSSQQYCYSCSYSFLSDKLEAAAKNKYLLASDEPPVKHKVISVSYSKHIGKDKVIPTLKITYYCLTGSFSEWICLSHDESNFARLKAVKWWNDRSSFPVPMSVDEALATQKLGNVTASIVEFSLMKPTEITVINEGKYKRIIGYSFESATSDNADDIPF